MYFFFNNIGKLKSFEVFGVLRNNFKELLVSIGCLFKLNLFRLEGNDFCVLLKEIEKLEKLIELDL